MNKQDHTKLPIDSFQQDYWKLPVLSTESEYMCISFGLSECSVESNENSTQHLPNTSPCRAFSVFSSDSTLDNEILSLANGTSKLDFFA